jgi:hypothetical protein
MKKVIMVKVRYWFAGAEYYDFTTALIHKKDLPIYRKALCFDKVEVLGFVEYKAPRIPREVILLRE